MSNEELFDTYFMTKFLALQKDRILNVRITLAKTLKKHLDSAGNLSVKNTSYAFRINAKECSYSEECAAPSKRSREGCEINA
jgi:hypothetical protein